MVSKLDEAKAELLDEAARTADSSLDDVEIQVLLRRYYRHAAPEDMAGRNPADVAGIALSHLDVARHRPQGTAAMRVFAPGRGAAGWTSERAVVQVVTDDMPFLVASVTAELTRQQRAIRLVIHPQLHVRRDLRGDLHDIADVTNPAYAPAGTIHESWIHVEFDRPPADEAAEVYSNLERGLRRVLDDARVVHEDWQKMRDRALRIAGELEADADGGGPLSTTLDSGEIAEAGELLRWLADENFTFLGYREYDLAEHGGEEVLRAVPGTGLGVLRADRPVSSGYSRLTPRGRAKAHEPRMLVLTKANTRSTVQRRGYLDYVGVKTFDENGVVVGERRFLGLFSTQAFTESVQRIPLLRGKVDQVMAAFGFDPMSYSGKDLLQILETYPREELFQVPAAELEEIVRAIMHLQERRRLKLLLRIEDYGRYFSALVYLPRDRFTTEVRLRLERILLQELNGTGIDFEVRHSESVLTRLHLVVRGAEGAELIEPDVDAIEARLEAATRSWGDDFADALLQEFGEEKARPLIRRYSGVLPETYKAAVTPTDAVADVVRLEKLRASTDPAAFTVSLDEPEALRPGGYRFKLYQLGQAVSLSNVLPVLQHMGMEVVDEHPHELVYGPDDVARVYEFGLRCDPVSSAAMSEEANRRFCDLFTAVRAGRAESDGFNALVPRAGLTWRQVTVLRAYSRYLRQAGTSFSQAYIQRVLISNRAIAKLLVKLFEARLDPRHEDARSDLVDGISEEVNGALDAVASLDEDRILRSLLAVIRATLRTNYFQRTPGGEPKAYLSFKLDPRTVPDLPLPRPRYEIWVYSPNVEGVHLRFGAVARGGLRWSDRREDFRTEILGLVKAQMVKNTVIVPVGAKGGFVAKKLPDPAVDRDAWLAEGVSCYQTFIRGLLDITDNLVDNAVVPPQDVVRNDGDDSYLVVAADKGTATFSDIANGVAADYGFWLGDAFASGGSVGYDHKVMGITARGAWESVKRHFRELGVDTQAQEFTVVGIGDMSGDVFGNGMLLSEHIRLVAAFDHRHIFIDPNPDAATSYAERRRIFDLPRSSWGDYNKALISAGGGVFPRSAKSIPLNQQIRDALNIDPSVGRVTPAELMRAILQAPVDLFWNGGIGTYVKAASEANADVGDKANDAIRINGGELRAKVVGEGGNLGFTQLGRVEYALTGGRINTDAIDNSAGVDTSDHEVNIKILLDRLVAAGELEESRRNDLLAGMTDEVARLVLRNNYGQNVALASSVAQAGNLLHVHSRYLRRLVRDGHLDRALEFLPTERQLNERRQNGGGLTQPEFAVLLAYTKITLADELLASDLPEDPYLREELYDYFPSPLRGTYREAMDSHPLRREIIVTQVVNNLVNNEGTTFLFRMREDTGASAEEIARAYTVARVALRAIDFWTAIDALDTRVPAAVQTRMRLDVRRLIERASRWFIVNRKHPLDIAAQLDYFADGIADVTVQLPKLLQAGSADQYESARAALAAEGVPDALATAVAGAPFIYSAFDIVEVAHDSGRPVTDVAAVYFDLAERLDFASLRDRITALPRIDRWSTMARSALRDDLYAAHAALTFDVLAAGPTGATPEERYLAWKDRNQAVVARARQVLDDIAASGSSDLATLSVALRVIRTLLRTSNLT